MHASDAVEKATFYRRLAEGYQLLGRPEKVDRYETAARVFERLAANAVVTQAEPAYPAGAGRSHRP